MCVGLCVCQKVVSACVPTPPFHGSWQSHMKMNPVLDFPSLVVDFVISASPALLSFFF